MTLVVGKVGNCSFNNVLGNKKFFIYSVFILVFFLGLGLSPAYATHILDSATYYNDHPFRLTITSPTSPPVRVIVNAGVTSCPYDLTNIPGTSTWQSPFIYFSGTTCSSTTFPLGASSSITATSDDVTPVSDTALVTSGNEVPWPPSPMSPQPLWGKKVTCVGTDGDDDGICDQWEDLVEFHGLDIPCVESASSCTGITPYRLPCGNGTTDPVCPDKNLKDVYVEVDWMKGHKPSQTAINDVVAAFANAGYGRLHVIVDNDNILHRDSITTPIAGGSGSTEFDTIKKAFFGTVEERAAGNENVGTTNHKLTSKKQVFHYALFIHKRTDDPTSSGVAEQPGNDFIISLGNSAFAGSVGSIDNQEGAFMHELGHNLKLDHGGNAADNCKPNYLSVMSYSREFREFYPIDRDLDYSRMAIGPTSPAPNTLDEAILFENISSQGGGGIESYVTSEMIVFGVSSGAGFGTASTGTSVNWDNVGGINAPGVSTSANINWMTPRGCDGANPAGALAGVKDWDPATMDLSTKDASSWSDGVRKAGSAFEFNYPVSTKYKDSTLQYYKDWMDKWWPQKYKDKVGKYIITNEITNETVRQIRSDNVNYLNYNIKSLKDSSFMDPANDKAKLKADLKIVNDFVMDDNMFDARFQLSKTRDDVKSLIVDNTDKKDILSKIDNTLMQFEIASITDLSIFPTTPLTNATVNFDKPDYLIESYATVTVSAKSANLDSQKVDTIMARISSTSFPVGMQISLLETGVNTGIFVQKDLHLHGGASVPNSDKPELRVKSGDTVTANYFGSLDNTIIN